MKRLLSLIAVTAALAFVLMANAAVDVGVVEVGLGGRWDATNVITAEVDEIEHVIDETDHSAGAQPYYQS